MVGGAAAGCEALRENTGGCRPVLDFAEVAPNKARELKARPVGRGPLSDWVSRDTHRAFESPWPVADGRRVGRRVRCRRKQNVGQGSRWAASRSTPPDSMRSGERHWRKTGTPWAVPVVEDRSAFRGHCGKTGVRPSRRILSRYGAVNSSTRSLRSSIAADLSSRTWCSAT